MSPQFFFPRHELYFLSLTQTPSFFMETISVHPASTPPPLAINQGRTLSHRLSNFFFLYVYCRKIEHTDRERGENRNNKSHHKSPRERIYCVSFTSAYIMAFPGGSDSKESACSAGDMGLIPGLGRSPREGNGNPLQYPCLENPMDGGAWRATVHGVAKSWTRLSD